MSGIKRSGKWFLLLSVVLLSLAITNPVQAEQKIYWIKADPVSAVINTTITVKVIVSCALDANLLPTSVNLIQVDENGIQLAIRGKLYDDGTHGDEAGGDNIFTSNITISETQPRYLYYKASVAYKGTLKRLLSDTLIIPVKTTITPDQVRLNVINLLTQGDTSNAKANFFPGKKADLLDNLTPEKRDLLKTWLQDAVLTTDTPNYKIYSTQWIDNNGVEHDIEFRMVPNGLGEWKISF